MLFIQVLLAESPRQLFMLHWASSVEDSCEIVISNLGYPGAPYNTYSPMQVPRPLIIDDTSQAIDAAPTMLMFRRC